MVIMIITPCCLAKTTFFMNCQHLIIVEVPLAVSTIQPQVDYNMVLFLISLLLLLVVKKGGM